MGLGMDRSKRVVSVALALAVPLTLTVACGGDGGEESSSDTLTLGQIVPVDNPAISFPGYHDGAEVAVRAINAEGGVAGNKLKLNFCDDKADPVQTAKCAEEAAGDEDTVALVASFSTNGAALMPVLESAELPSLGSLPLAPIDAESPMAFPLSAGGFYYSGFAEAASEEVGAKTAVIVSSDAPGTDARIAAATAGAKEAGVKILDTTIVPANTLDFSNVVTKAVSKNPDAILGVGVNVPDQVKYWKAAGAQGVEIPYFTTASAATPDNIESGGAGAENSYMLDVFPRWEGDEEWASEFREDFEAYGDGAELSSDAFRGWASVKAFQEIAEGIDGSIDRKSFLEALNSTTSLDTLFFTGVDLTKAGPIEAYPRITVTTVYVNQIVDGAIVATDTTVNLTQ